MASTVQHKRSTTSGNAPTLTAGELAFQLADKRILTANNTTVFDAFQNTSSNISIVSSTGMGLLVGNSTVNAQINSAGLILQSVGVIFYNGTSLVANVGQINVGSNVFIVNTGIILGNTTVNTVINSTSYMMSNSTVQLNYTLPSAAQALAGTYYLGADGTWRLASGSPGGSNTYLQFNDSSAFGGVANLVYNKTTNQLTVGNSTINTAINSVAIVFGGNAIVNSTVFTVGNSTVNATQNSTGFFVGTSFYQGALTSWGNSTINTIANSTIIKVANSTVSATLSVGLVFSGNSTVNASLNSTSLTFANSTVTYSPVTPVAATAFTQQQYFTLATLTDGATINWAAAGAQKAKVTIAGNRTMAAVTGAVEGATYLLWVIQDGTGSRTLSWTTSGAGSFDFGTAGAPTLTTTASQGDLLSFEAITIASTLKLRFAGIAKGFS